VLKVRRDDDIKAYKPYQAYIYDGSYPLFRSIYMITTAANGSIAHGFYSFVTGFKGQKIIQMTGILPATVQPRMVNLN
jgi:phosphate transport system substrate-binding protein